MERGIDLARSRLGGQAAQVLGQMPGHKTHLRLLAISKCGLWPQQQVAEFFEISPATLRRWLAAFRQRGLAGLEARPRGHRAAKLGDRELRVIGRWLRDGVDPRGQAKVWTLEGLRGAVREHFGICISLMPLWKHLDTNHLRKYLPRKRAGKAAQNRAPRTSGRVAK